ncbi:hypothetical protein HAX54_007966 [Datura stramonium]|uniref:Uncharacterized protein n=1 Tax=Datura stramonium TaxID=4076 RepID=A0ABS8RXG2_DATST|nr:hypothetical protein [Datura stramonium]
MLSMKRVSTKEAHVGIVILNYYKGYGPSFKGILLMSCSRKPRAEAVPHVLKHGNGVVLCPAFGSAERPMPSHLGHAGTLSGALRYGRAA